MKSYDGTKKCNFRLPKRTIEKINDMVELEQAKNMTDAIIVAIDRFSDSRIDVLEKRVSYLEKVVIDDDKRISEKSNEG